MSLILPNYIIARQLIITVGIGHLLLFLAVGVSSLIVHMWFRKIRSQEYWPAFIRINFSVHDLEAYSQYKSK